MTKTELRTRLARQFNDLIGTGKTPGTLAVDDTELLVLIDMAEENADAATLVRHARLIADWDTYTSAMEYITEMVDDVRYHRA